MRHVERPHSRSPKYRRKGKVGSGRGAGRCHRPSPFKWERFSNRWSSAPAAGSAVECSAGRWPGSVNCCCYSRLAGRPGKLPRVDCALLISSLIFRRIKRVTSLCMNIELPDARCCVTFLILKLRMCPRRRSRVSGGVILRMTEPFGR